MEEIKRLLWLEYPIPPSVSIWGEEGSDSDLNFLIRTCVKELQSDLPVVDFMTARSNVNKMPEDTIGILSCQFDLPTQGNAYVKKTYISATKTLYLRYFPCNVKFRRKLHVEDVDNLEGDRLVYFKYYVLLKMVTKELVQVTSVDLSVDTGDVNVEDLRKFQGLCEDKIKDLKEGILIYFNS